MITKTVDVREAEKQLNELLSLVAAGGEVILTDGATPVARLAPLTMHAAPRVAGLHAGAVWTSKDFDEPLPQEFWTGIV